MKILLDAGHSLAGGDIGARGCGLKEEVETREMVELIKTVLTSNGHTVVLCHNNSTTNTTQAFSLESRVDVANKNLGDLFVSVHLNAFNSQAFGTEVYFFPGSSYGKKYAQKVHDKLSKFFFGRGVKEGRYYVLKNTKSPAILVEVCFIDNKDDIAIYKNNKIAIAESIASGIVGTDIKYPKPTSPVSGTTYRVIAGSFKNKDNAVARMKEVEQKTGLDCFIDEYKI